MFSHRTKSYHIDVLTTLAPAFWKVLLMSNSTGKLAHNTNVTDVSTPYGMK